MKREKSHTALVATLCFQGFYFAATALWALIDIDSFMLVTGPKTDIWLVKTMSLLILAIGITLLASVFCKRAVLDLAVLSALFLGVAEIYYVLTNQIARIYLVDALIEFVIIIAYAVIKWARHEQRAESFRF
jgi:hypothetical protein